MAYLDDLQDRRNAISRELASIDKESAGGIPNALASEGGIDADHQGYKEKLYAELKDINELIEKEASIQAQIAGQGNAFEIDSEAWG